MFGGAPFGSVAFGSLLSTGSVSASDTATGVEAATLVVTLGAVADTGSGSDAASLLASSSASDTGSGSDAVSALSVTSSTSDTGGGSEAASLVVTISVSDTGSGLEAATLAVTISVSDTGSGVEATSTVATSSAADSGSATDAASLSTSSTAADTGSGSESTLTDVTTSGSDTGSSAEAATTSTITSDADSATGTDAASLLASGGPDDTASAAEAASLVATLSANDPGTGAEVAGIALAAAEAATADDEMAQLDVETADADTATDVEAFTVALAISDDDSGSGVDADGGVGLSDADAASGTEAVGDRTLADADSATGLDAHLLSGDFFDRVHNSSGPRDYLTKVRAGGGVTTTYVDHQDNVRNIAQIIVPSYIYPTWFLLDPTSAWDRLQAQSTANGGITSIVMVNPNSGPDIASNSDYVTQVADAQAAGLKVFGYVATTFGAKTEADAKDEVDKYIAWYGVDGIFFDEVDNTLTNLAYYTDLCDYVRATITHGGTILDFGTECPVDFTSVADYLCTFEGDAASYASRADVAWELASTTPRQIYHIVYGISGTDELDLVIRLARDRNAGSFYFTDDVLPNPYDTVPPDPIWLRENDNALLVNPVDIALTLEDAVGLADSAALVVDYVRLLEDATGLTDTVSRVVHYHRSPSDDAGPSDAIVTAVGWARLVQDRAGVADSLSLEPFLVFNDGGPPCGCGPAMLHDTVTRVVAYIRTPEETLDIADGVTFRSRFARHPSDAIGLADTIAKELAIVIGDAVGLHDTATEQATYVRTVSDALISDRVVAAAGYDRTVIPDTVGVMDSHRFGINLGILDTAALSDLASGLRIVGVNENVTATETQSVVKTLLRIHLEALSVTYADHSGMMKIGARQR